MSPRLNLCLVFIMLSPLSLSVANAQTADDAPAPPEPVVTSHEMTIDGETLSYDAQVEMLEITDDAGDPTAHLFTVAYTAGDGDGRERPVTFLMNGGPGAASAYLHVGGVGPRTIRTDAEGRPVGGGELISNPDTWLAFTDLVFLDPVGTGFSRAVEADDDRFYNREADLNSLAQAIEVWLDERDRRASPVYLAGESYGGYRAAALPKRLMHDRGVQIAGVILISPVIDFATIRHSPGRPLSWALVLPSYAATAAAHGKAEPIESETLAAFALEDYVMALIHPERMDAILPRLAELTGLDEEFLRQRRGRVQPSEYRRRLLANEGLLISSYDGLLTVPDPTPERAEARVDLILDGMTPAFAGGFLDHLRRNLEWRHGRDYELLNREVSRAWSFGVGRGQGYVDAMTELREVLALDSDFRVLAAHGETDLVTPWLASSWLLEQIDDTLREARGRTVFARYPGGHMFYMRPNAGAALRIDAKAFYAGR